MRAQRRTGTAPELALRRALWARGLRYRVDARLPLPRLRRRADLLFPGAQVAVFVDGCFWHDCPKHGTRPKMNADWWAEKIAGNVRRDRDTDDQLRAIGWQALRLWEHDDPFEAADWVEGVVRATTALIPSTTYRCSLPRRDR
jgi:DNA mismatch endonuclease (patch repair protein)